MMDDEAQRAYCLDYINNHPTMEARTKVLLAEIVKGEMSKDDLVELVFMLAAAKGGPK